MKKVLYIALIAITIFSKGHSQEIRNPITTAAPFLLVVPDARSGGMADIGIASTPDANSLHHNPAKFTFLESQYVVGVNYTPWLRNLTSDVFVGNITFANRINENSAWGASLKYFSLGTIDLTDGSGASAGSENPNELSLDLTYGLKLSEKYGMAVGLRYIRSDYALNIDNSNIKTVNTYAVDVSGYYQSEEINYGGFNGIWRGGFNISNIGPKVSLVDGGQENFVPTNLKLGGGFQFVVDDYNSITANLEFNKLLVPTPNIPVTNTNGETIAYRQEDVGFIGGIFQSFNDAPNGFSEELKEFTWALGAEYLYNKTFAIRTGYFNENDLKGSRKFFTLGAGFRFNAITLDLSYLINSSTVNNPLENTLRFSLSFDFGDSYEGY